MDLQILSDKLLPDYRRTLGESPLDKAGRLKPADLQVDYFDFYRHVAAVYSAKISGENIDPETHFDHTFGDKKLKTSAIKRTDDLYAAYELTENKDLNYENFIETVKLLCKNVLSKEECGAVRKDEAVPGRKDHKEIPSAPVDRIQKEIDLLFQDISTLLSSRLDAYEVFYYAAYIHLAFMNIYPFRDGNGRSARLLEKWFLTEKLGEKAIAVKLEKNYFENTSGYKNSLRKTGTEYNSLNYDNALDFLLLTAQAVDKQDQ